MQRLRYVLSAGRTGTVYLERMINRKLVGVRASHEPGSSRYLMMLANLRNDWGVGGRTLQYLFEQGRSRRQAKNGPCYVELNPFLCAFTDLLPKKGYSLHVVHAIRDPADWARSITGFKASEEFRTFIDFIPFAKPYPSPRPKGWSDLSEYERNLWRWNWCNTRIGELHEHCESYSVVRYEDMFSKKGSIRSAQLHRLSETLLLPDTIKASTQEMAQRENAFIMPEIHMDRNAAREICGALARKYGYDY